MSDPRSASALRALLAASSAAGMLCASPVVAGEPGPATPEAEPLDPQVAPIVVNGRRPSEPRSPEYVAPLVDTPRAVTVIPRQLIEQTAATSLQDLLRNSPGITFGAGEGGQPLADRPFIRGQASGNNVFVDGLRDTGGQQREVFNLEQVEVIKGPDAVYSGRGSGGGSINLGSKTPQTVDFTRLSVGLGTDAYRRTTLDVNRALGDTAGFRLNLMESAGDVAGRDAVDFDKWGAAVALAFGLGTDTSVTLGGYHLTSNQMPDYGIPLYTKLGGAGAPRPDPSGILDVPYDSFYGLRARDYLTVEVDSLTLSVEHRISEAVSIRNVSRWSETLNDYVVTNPGDGGSAVLVGGEWWMQRATKSRWNPTATLANVTDIYGRFGSGDVRHSWDVGLELSHERNRNASWAVVTTSGTACPAPLTGFDCTPVYDPDPSDPWTGTITRNTVVGNTTRTAGLYAFDSIEFGSRWLLNLGLRHDRYEVEGEELPRGATVPVPSSGEWSFTNYQIGLVFKPTDHSSLYVSAASAATPPTISAGDQNGTGGTGSGNLSTTLLDPEETFSLEAGAKASLYRDQLVVSAALFHLTRENAQIQVSPGVYEQAGKARVTGLELGVSGNITADWQLFGGYTWMDSELVEGAYNNANIGDPLANTPEHSVSLFSTYRLTPRLTLGGGVYHVSDSFGGNQGGAGGGSNRIFAPDWTRVDLFGSWTITDRAELQLNVQNAGDEAYILRTNGVHHADVAPGRSAILTLNLAF